MQTVARRALSYFDELFAGMAGLAGHIAKNCRPEEQQILGGRIREARHPTCTSGFTMSLRLCPKAAAGLLSGALAAIGATAVAAEASPAGPPNPGFSIRSQGVGLCVRTPKDGLKMLEVRVVQPSDNPARDKAVQAEFLGQSLPPQIERAWSEWLALWVGVDQTVEDGRTLGTLVPAPSFLDCSKYEKDVGPTSPP